MTLQPMNDRDAVSYMAPNNGVLIHDIKLANAEHIPGVDSYVGRANATLRGEQLGLHFDFDSEYTEADHASWEAIGLPVVKAKQLIGIEQDGNRSLVWSTITQVQRDAALRNTLQHREIFPFIRHKAFDELAELTGGSVIGKQEGVNNWNNKNHVMQRLQASHITTCPGEYVTKNSTIGAQEACRSIVRSLYQFNGFRGMAIKELDAVSGLGITKLGSAVTNTNGDPVTPKHAVSLEHIEAELEVALQNEELLQKIAAGKTRIEGWIGESVSDPRFSGTVIGSPSIGLVIQRGGQHVRMGKDGTSDQLLENSMHCANIYPSVSIENNPIVQEIGEKAARAAYHEGVIGPMSVDLVVLQRDDGEIGIYPVETNCRFSGPTHGFALHHDWSRMHNLDSREIAFGAGNLPIHTGRIATASDLYEVLRQDQWLATKDNVLNNGLGIIVANSAPLPSGKVHIVALARRSERQQIVDVFKGNHELNAILKPYTEPMNV